MDGVFKRHGPSFGETGTYRFRPKVYESTLRALGTQSNEFPIGLKVVSIIIYFLNLSDQEALWSGVSGRFCGVLCN